MKPSSLEAAKLQEGEARVYLQREYDRRRQEEEGDPVLYDSPSGSQKAKPAFCNLACLWRSNEGEQLAVGNGLAPEPQMTFEDYLQRLYIRENYTGQPKPKKPPRRMMRNVNIREHGGRLYDFLLDTTDVDNLCGCTVPDVVNSYLNSFRSHMRSQPPAVYTSFYKKRVLYHDILKETLKRGIVLKARSYPDITMTFVERPRRPSDVQKYIYKWYQKGLTDKSVLISDADLHWYLYELYREAMVHIKDKQVSDIKVDRRLEDTFGQYLKQDPTLEDIKTHRAILRMLKQHEAAGNDVSDNPEELYSSFKSRYEEKSS